MGCHTWSYRALNDSEFEETKNKLISKELRKLIDSFGVENNKKYKYKNNNENYLKDDEFEIEFL